MGKAISLHDMARMYCLSDEKLETYALDGMVPSHRHSVDGSVLFTSSDMFEIDRLKLLTGLPLTPGRFAPQ